MLPPVLALPPLGLLFLVLAGSPALLDDDNASSKDGTSTSAPSSPGWPLPPPPGPEVGSVAGSAAAATEDGSLSVPPAEGPLFPIASTTSSSGVPCRLTPFPPLPLLLPFLPAAPSPGAGLDRRDAGGVELSVIVRPRSDPGEKAPSPASGGGVMAGVGVPTLVRPELALQNGSWSLGNHDGRFACACPPFACAPAAVAFPPPPAPPLINRFLS